MADVTVLLTRVLSLIEQPVRREVKLMLDADVEVQNLSKTLKEIIKVLADAEQRQVTNPRIQSWLQKLREIAYETEDVLEEWEVEDFKQRLEEFEAAASSELSSDDDSWEKKVCSILESVCLCFKQIAKRRGIALHVKEINERLDSLAQEDKTEFNFVPNWNYDSPPENHKRNRAELPKTKSRVEMSEIHGRHADRDFVKDVLLSESSHQGGSDLKIITIVGGGGMGKTTLAQLIFNDESIKIKFKVRIWVCVSDPFDEVRVYKSILEGLGKDPSKDSEPEALLRAIEKEIEGQLFLLVLDDVWTKDNRDTWNPLKLTLKEGCALGSSILVTTRKKGVADAMVSTHVHTLKGLSVEDCWLILSQEAFYNKMSDCVKFKGVGMEIAKKCKGMPLAAKAMGRFLHNKRSLDKWTRVLTSELWKLNEVNENIFPYLRFSYDELTPTHRRCFSYCALFPKDSILEVDELVRIWTAQGFLPSSSLTEGYEYFEDLAMRSFFQEFEKDDDDDLILRCKMHDIVHDFVLYLTKNELVTVQQINGGATKVSCKDVRHLSMTLPGDSEMTCFPIDEPMKLRSLLCNFSLSPSLLIQLRGIRLLIVKKCDLKEIPKEIGDLIHIKYLDISENPLEILPETICDLYYLQTLNITYCYFLCGFPQGVHKLINLRYLLNNCRSTDEFEFSQGLEELTNLLRLSKFCATKNNKLGWLEKLNQLGGQLALSVDNEVDEADAKKANLKQKESLKELKLRCWSVEKLEVVEALQPHPNLQILYFVGRILPKWLSSITNLKSLEINVKYAAPDAITDLGKLAFVELLKITSDGMMKVGLLDKASFPQLKILMFSHCYDWKEWEDISEEEGGEDWEDISEEEGGEDCEVLPCLQQLYLRNCPKLKALPHRILSKAPLLKILKVSRCYELSRHYRQDAGGQQEWHKISSHIPNIDFSFYNY